MGLFRVSARLTGPSGVTGQAELPVDAGATLLALPASFAERLGVTERRRQPVVAAGGRREKRLVPVDGFVG